MNKLEEIYLNIINEQYKGGSSGNRPGMQRYSLRDLIIATCIITHGGKDQWIKKEDAGSNSTASKIFELMKKYGSLKIGNKTQNGTAFLIDSPNGEYIKELIASDPEFFTDYFKVDANLYVPDEHIKNVNDAKNAILWYWNRADKSIANELELLDDEKYGRAGFEYEHGFVGNKVEARKVGLTAYWIWRGLHESFYRYGDKKNETTAATQQAEIPYKIKDKITGLQLQAQFAEVNKFGYKEIICIDPKTNLKFKLNVESKSEFDEDPVTIIYNYVNKFAKAANDDSLKQRMIKAHKELLERIVRNKYIEPIKHKILLDKPGLSGSGKLLDMAGKELSNNTDYINEILALDKNYEFTLQIPPMDITVDGVVSYVNTNNSPFVSLKKVNITSIDEDKLHEYEMVWNNVG